MYQAIIAKIHNLRPIPGADRIVVGTVLGCEVIVGIDTKDGDIGILFMDDGVLSHEYASANNLYKHPELNSDKTKSGFFSDTPRVKCQRFKGVKSEAYFAPLDSLSFTKGNLSTLVLGYAFTEFGGVKICDKYYTPATIRAMKQGKSNQLKRVQYFREHEETQHIVK